tara:strand:+ start:1310 stop:1555 length:246 start_codon:yes stop_codon:yes gene_type:complete
MPQEKYPANCPWDFGPKQKLSDRDEWRLASGPDFYLFYKDKLDENWFFIQHNHDEPNRVLQFRARLTYQKLLDKGFKLRTR